MSSATFSNRLGVFLRALAGLLAAGLLAACTTAAAAPQTHRGRPGASSAAVPERAHADAVRRYHATRAYREVAVPVHLQIPAIGVDASVEGLSRLPDHTLAVPSSPDRAGWYQDGPRPGEPGAAVIVGHVDSRTGPAVFYRLADLRAGTPITVTRADGTLVRFRVDRLLRVAKAQFPTDLVYYPTLDTVLRLVTCGGAFDSISGHYEDNIVAFASLIQ